MTAGTSLLDEQGRAKILEQTGKAYVRVQDNYPVPSRAQRRAFARAQRRRGK